MHPDVIVREDERLEACAENAGDSEEQDRRYGHEKEHADVAPVVVGQVAGHPLADLAALLSIFLLPVCTLVCRVPSRDAGSAGLLPRRVRQLPARRGLGARGLHQRLRLVHAAHAACKLRSHGLELVPALAAYDVPAKLHVLGVVLAEVAAHFALLQSAAVLAGKAVEVLPERPAEGAPERLFRALPVHRVGADARSHVGHARVVPERGREVDDAQVEQQLREQHQHQAPLQRPQAGGGAAAREGISASRLCGEGQDAAHQ
mmetsp:Transcript_78168/g.229103  ORF Transcript_78168/g.229103 Transcript_78168/m.229103 type:complete len:261 (-) Transcript_78168:315-1097(-)